MTITIEYGFGCDTETFHNVTCIAPDKEGIFFFYKDHDCISYRYLRYTNYVTITIH